MALRRGGLLAVMLLAGGAACATPAVRTDSASQGAAPPASSAPSGAPPSVPDTTVPDDTVPDTTTVPDTEAPDREPPATGGADDPSTSSGDPLFPELGSADLDVQSYDLRLSYEPDERLLAGTVTITMIVTRPLEEVTLDAANLTVTDVTVDGAPATFEQTSTELFVRPPVAVGPGAPVVVAVTYRDDEHTTGSAVGLPAGWYPTETGSYALNEPDGARSWLPSNDHPSDKATWHFELTVPADIAAVANGELIEQRPVDSGTTTWIWEQSEPMATYLVQLLTGDYQVLDGGLAGVVPLTNVALTRDTERMQRYFDLTDDQVEFFEPLFGPYPLDRYGLAFTESEPGLAMETQGRSLFARDDFPAGTPGYTQHLLLAHELAHQWFGNAVTPAAWADLWLNESFATYAQWLWLDNAGFTVLEREARINLEARQFPTEATGDPSTANLFGYERYDGGAVVVHALREEIGDEAFFRLLQRWVADNDGTSRTTEDFIALAELVAGRPLAEFFDDWLYSRFLPSEFPDG